MLFLLRILIGQVGRQRAHLAALDDRLLTDMGIARSEIPSLRL